MGIKLVGDSGSTKPVTENPDEAKIQRELNFIREHSDWTDTELAEELGISRWSVQRRRRKLKVTTAERNDKRDDLLSELSDLIDERSGQQEKLDEVDQKIDDLVQKLARK